MLTSAFANEVLTTSIARLRPYDHDQHNQHWTRLNSGNPVLEPGMMDGDRENYVYNVFVLLEQGTFHMWYSASFKQFGSNAYQPRSNAITYASSKDGTRWKKDTTPVLHNGPLGSIDEYAAFACCVVRRNDGLWMYYSCGTQNPRLYRTTLAIHRF